jgi:small subunit ribosomal protein S17
MEQKRNPKRTVRGVVVRRSGDKSIKIELQYMMKHPVYGKYIRRRTRLGVHDEKNEAGPGDVVDVAECRPMSKTKSWRLLKVVQKASER